MCHLSAPKNILSAIASRIESSSESGHRTLLVLAGERVWSRALVEQIKSASINHGLLFNDNIWVTSPQESVAETIANEEAKQLLGQEFSSVVYDVWSGLNPDALAAVTGTIVGGGLLVLLVPDLEQWPAFNDPDFERIRVHPFSDKDYSGRFIRQLIDGFRSNPDCMLIEQNAPSRIDIPVSVAPKAELKKDSDGCITECQSKAVRAIQSVLNGRSRRPLVLTSDRGRGKSAALGIASALSMQHKSCRIIITAPRVSAVKSAFQHATKLLGLSLEKNHIINWKESELRFVPPDELVRSSWSADLLLIDEAAAIPSSILENLLDKYNRIVFATTVHGYEGTGRGFDVRFKKILHRKTPQWRSISMDQPIRWSPNDPLEQWLFDALLLNAEPIDPTYLQSLTAGRCLTEKLCRDTLLSEPELLRELFGLLVLAHYQTTPSDLRVLLDGLNIDVWVTRFQGHIVTAALVAKEGGFDQAMSEAVWKSERRPRGNLLPQTLSAHAGFKQASELRYQRIVRIAVHPSVQRKSLGKQLLDTIVEYARAENYDCVGSSFAAVEDVLAFWRSANFIPVSLGVNRDTSTGCHSVAVLCSLSKRGEELLGLARARFNENIARELMILYQRLEPELVVELLIGTIKPEANELSHQDWLSIEAFAEGYRQYDMCLLPLWKFVCMVFSDVRLCNIIESTQKQLLVLRVLQSQSIAAVAKECGYTGKKELEKELRFVIESLRKNVLQRKFS